ncbi:zinc-ribbon domain-containing protein [Asticcacaulis sp. BYS171W]|uniref:Zinc-ribbon domain-containing protein n=1 Tax=Asticcacaulis aquaticus TaxID=2984212 RepID=A0ABT5HSU2_9CAUL|nr:MJ0042-type zinc finger domain-containing protein [Asticcacaulis aquaticus]MDC7683130.1 zinc-ribbon domain-containing protein [Asticcacaulis aquaticus]
MLVTCPKCALAYAIDDAQLGPQGRTVRCAACKTTWHAHKAEEPIELPLDKAVEKPAVKAPKKLAEVKAKKIPSMYREMIEGQKRHKALMAQGIIWSALAATFVMIMAGAYLLRVDVVKSFPRLAGAYAAVGVPVNAAGLEFVSQKAETVLRGGRFAVTVTAVVRNVRNEETPVPPVRVKILDEHGAEVGSILIPPQGLTVEPNATRTLVFDLPDAQNQIKLFDLGFDMQAMKDMQRLRPSMLKGDHADPAEDHATPAAHEGDAHGDGHDAAPAGHDAPVADAVPIAEDHGDGHAPADTHEPAPTDHAPETHAPAQKLPELKPAHGASDAGHH